MSSATGDDACTTTAAGVDMISANGDDVLLRILELVPDARDAMRTGALSRRWRGLWKRLPALRFACSGRPEFAAAPRGGNSDRRYVGFVNQALDLRRSYSYDQTGLPVPDLQHLSISFAMTELPRSFKPAGRWVVNAVRRHVRSVALELHREADDDVRVGEWRRGNPSKATKKQYVVDLAGLPSSAELETMRLALAGAKLRLPAAATFASLVDLSLENLQFTDGSGHALSRLVSSPRLRKLRLRKINFFWLHDELQLEAEELVELWCDIVEGPVCIPRLSAPALRVLRMVNCDLALGDFSAPRLEKLVFFASLPSDDESNVDMDGKLSSVKSLKIGITDSLAHSEQNSASIRILECCTAATCLDVELHIFKKPKHGIDVLQGRIPQLPQVISLTVRVIIFELHSFEAVIADIIRQCSKIKYLCIRCTFEKSKALMKSDFLCDLIANHWKPCEINLPHLKTVKFTGLAGTDCELLFIQSMLTNTSHLQKAAISFDPNCSLTMNRINVFKRIRPFEGGTWTSCDEAYLALFGTAVQRIALQIS